MKDKKQETKSGETKKYDVFISYRREGGFEFAEKLHKRLLEDGYGVAFDIDTLRNGRFDRVLLSRVEECTDFVVVLNKGCFDRTLDASFPPEKDWMRKELAHALKMKKNVVPVMLTGFDWPNGLPDDIRDAEFMNGPKYDPIYFASFYEELKEKFLVSRSQVAARSSATANQQLDLPALGKPVDEVALSGLKGQDAKHFKKACGYYNVNRYRSAWAEFKKIEEQGNAFVKYYVLVLGYVLEGNVDDSDFEESCCGARDLGCTDAMRIFADRHLPNDTKTFDIVPPAECIQWLKKAIANGDADALANLGDAYENARGVEKNLTTARELYKRSCEAGSLAGQMTYGLDCLLGNAGDKDLMTAGKVLRPVIAHLRKYEDELSAAEYCMLMMWYSDLNSNIVKPDSALVERYAKLIIESKGRSIGGDAADKGAAYMVLGLMNLKGAEEPEKAKSAFEFFQKEKTVYDRDGSADYWLAKCYDTGIGVEANPAMALEYYETAAGKGNAAAQCALAIHLFDNEDESGVERGKRLLRLAAEGGDSDAEHLYGLWLIRGVYFDRNIEEGMKWLEKAAVQDNDADALNSLGEQYRDGTDGVGIDHEKAFKWFEKGAVGGSTNAMQSLGWAYLTGQGTVRNVAEAEKWFVRAAEAGSPDAMESLGLAYLIGDGIGVDVDKAKEWLIRAAENGNASAECSLGTRYAQGQFGEKDIVEAVKWWEKAAGHGDTTAMENLGLIYFDGDDGIEKDVMKALEWLTRAADNGDESAACKIGAGYYRGDFGEPDKKKAFYWSSKAAQLGDATAMNNLGEMYRDGDGVGKDMRQAIRYFQDSAKRNNPKAMTNLGFLYLVGDGVMHDAKMSEEWFVKAADTGDADAECLIGTLYARGAFGKVEYVKAKEWWEKSAEQCNLTAMNELGIMCLQGFDDAPQDRRQAFDWFKMAAEAGLPDAMEQLGLAYLQGAGTDVDEEEAKKWLICASDKGRTSAACTLGSLYARDDYWDKDLSEAVKWWERAAEHGDTTAMCNLGCIFSDPDLSDNVIQIDMDEARKWFQKADDAGSECAAYHLGLDVLGVLGNRYETYAEWQKAFKALNPEIGPVRRILRKAGSWFQKPLDAHTDDASLAGACLRWLARIARYQEDLENAKDLYRQAVEKGDEKAKKELAEMESNGDTVGDSNVMTESQPSVSAGSQVFVAPPPSATPSVSVVHSIPVAPQATVAAPGSATVPPVPPPADDEMGRAETLFLRKARRLKRSEGRIDPNEKSELRELAAELGLSVLRREELIEQVEEEYEAGI